MNNLNNKQIIGILLIFCISNLFASDDNIFLEIPKNFLKGILEANYKETPFDEFLPINSVAIPLPVYPNRKEHPSLLFKKEDAQLIRSRFTKEPYRSWGENMIDRALTYNYDLTSPLLYELRRSEAAKANAFAYFITSESTFLETAKLALLNIGDTFPPTTPEGQESQVGWGDWMRAAQALRNFAVAYDLIYWELNEDQREIIENQLIKQVEQHHRNFRKFPDSLSSNEIASGIGIPQNNHIIEIASGVATVALIVDHKRAKRYFDDAINELQHGLAMIEVDGSYREGAYYGRYVASILFPFAHYLNNSTNTNILKVPRLKKFIRWLIDIEKSDGSVPLFDDAFYHSSLFQPLGSGLTKYENELVFLYEENKENYKESDLKYIDVFCGFDDRTFPIKPDYDPAIYYPDGGMSIFRGEMDIYALFLGEPDRKNDTHHDHFEPGAFTLSAFNKDFLIDSGYGIKGVNDVNRTWFISAQAHNIPLINGLGPNLNPVWGDELNVEMYDYFGSEHISASVIRSNYRETDITRSIWFTNQRYFVVLDEFESDRKNRYSIPWHGLGTLEKTNTTCAKWVQETSCLDVEFISKDDNALLLTQKTGLHTKRVFNNEHQILEARLPPSKENKFISIFIPNQIGEAQISASKIEANSNGKVNARIIEDQHNNWKDYIILADSVWQCGNVSSDADITVFHKNKFDEVEYLSAKNVTFFIIDNEEIFRAEKPIDITLNLVDDGWFGYLSSKYKSSNFIEFFPKHTRGFMIFNNKIVEFDVLDSAGLFATAESGIFDFHPSQNRIYTTEKFKPYYPVLSNLNFSQDPHSDIEQMNNFEKVQLRNEIIKITGEAALNTADSLLNYPLKNIYGITAGIINSAWSSSESFKINLPQSFKLNQNIVGKEVAYFEEGYITDKGISTKFHRLEIENTLYFQQENYYEDHSLTSAELNYQQYHLYADREQYNSDIDYQFAFDRYFSNGTIGLQHSREEAEESRNGIILNYNNWNSNAVWSQAEDNNDYYFSISKNGRRFSGNLTGDFNQENGLQNFLFTNSILISNNFLFNSGFRRYEMNNKESEFYNSNIYYYLNNLSGSLSVFKAISRKHRFNWRMNYNYKKFNFVHLGELQNILIGDFEIRYRSRNISWNNTLHQGKTTQFKIAYNSKKYWSANTGFELNLISSDVNRISGGVHFNAFIRTGLDVNHALFNKDEWLGICWVIDSRIFENELLNLYTNTFFNDDMEITYYEIIVSQMGQSYSPGIKIKKDHRGFITGEGYICWEF
ncbi:MAG: heparinase II/III family protein [Candidatus Cloacimonetes bacterium]|nr:heparinase II/III family protein [Candidatus Cloacimonadota bacterium]